MERKVTVRELYAEIGLLMMQAEQIGALVLPNQGEVGRLKKLILSTLMEEKKKAEEKQKEQPVVTPVKKEEKKEGK